MERFSLALAARALVAEAVAQCEHAQTHFEQIHAELLKAINEGRRITSPVSNEENDARAKLLDARLELSKRLRRRRRAIEALEEPAQP